MATAETNFLREQLLDRKHRLESALTTAPENSGLAELLAEVDSALERMADGTYGFCKTCHDPIEQDRLLSDPLVCYCLDHLTPSEQRALERDLELAAQIQRQLLPPREMQVDGWEVCHHYEPAGPVSGDYCDLIADSRRPREMFFVLADVSGKGVAASMLMTHMHAMFRSLAGFGLPLEEMVALANRIFCESALAGQYATLVCGRVRASGEVELHNAGHWPLLVVRRGEIAHVPSSGVPLGMFPGGQFRVSKLVLHRGESLFLYSDGLIETQNAAGEEFGADRLASVLGGYAEAPAKKILEGCLAELAAFRGKTSRADDLTILVVRRTA